MQKTIKIGDIAVVITILIMGVLISIIFAGNALNGGYVEIYQDNKLIFKYSLSSEEDKKIVLTNRNIENVVEIKDGQVGFTHSNCKDQVCVETGMISKDGQIAVCLPSRTIVKIVGTENEVDVIAN